MPQARPWTPAEDALLGTHFDRVVAKRLRRRAMTVYKRRRLLKIAVFGPRGKAPPCRWGATELSMLGRYPDAKVARITGRSLQEVQAKRKELRSSK
jgi:hypothetical protein